jgi:hypothetical protein
MTRLSTAALLLCLAAIPTFAQTSATVHAGNLSGKATAGVTDNDRDDRANTEHDRQVARGPRVDKDRDCDSRGVSVHNGNSSASASVSTSPGGSSVVAGGGSPGSHTEYFDCDHDKDRSTR